MNFLTLEAGYIFIGIFILLITAFVTTRPFVSKSMFKIFMPAVLLFMSLAIFYHYQITSNRMQEINDAFYHGKSILCENKSVVKVAPAVVIRKSDGWKLENGLFSSPNFEREFHSARCIIDNNNI